ncbi:molecular chaperone HtpG [Candidatus Bandiella euplotis]|uniref:Chaperone protein HtpG n=1 Tax=Candidatus Bandiella euplotis TaxID=1664265 RepID=A0ABZ0UQ98_9RICK|nr:molecular chaperone HtpG [Candidatus Bandiella woodruffii]WPX96883.1 Chaperone protein HtpG [Candidatus Bandiella woodruffii]
MENSKQIKKFDAEVGKVLNLMINSIYTNKDIFLRELVSNASDACDKLRYQAINDPKLMESVGEFKIVVQIDRKEQSISISDNGIGMNKEELISSLGTIASSGTQKFVEQFANNDKKADLQLIGQFGVGFYSAFMVADSVEVISKKAGEKNAYLWASDGKGEYSIEKYSGLHASGTRITLKIKESETEFLEPYRLRHIIHTYSDHIEFPIELIDDEGKSEVVNKAAAIWMRNPSEVTQEQYEEFFKHASHSPGKPWMTLHNKVEGAVEYTNLLFIPESKPFDLFHPDRKTRVKLYIKRVFISEEGNDLIPPYLRFLRGVIDSQDLPLNISRETLQHNQVVRKIKKSIVKKVLSSLKTKADKEPEEYAKFWNNFSEVVKEGLCESTLEEKEQLLEICRFHSTNSQETTVSLDDYLSRMVEGQKEIYFLNGDNINALRANPQLEGFKKKGIEVLLLKDHVDNFWVNIVHKYKDMDFKSVTSENIDLDKVKDSDSKKEGEEEKGKIEYPELLQFIKDVLKDKVRDVVVSSKLVDSPACISMPEGSMNPRMERFLIDQRQLHSKSARILEINPNHAIFKKINGSLSNGEELQLNSNLVDVIYTQACLIEGDSVDNLSDFASKLNSILAKIV